MFLGDEASLGLKCTSSIMSIQQLALESIGILSSNEHDNRIGSKWHSKMSYTIQFLNRWEL